MDATNGDDRHIISESIQTGDGIVADDGSYKEETGQIAGFYCFMTEVSQGNPCYPQLGITGDCNIPGNLADNDWTQAVPGWIYVVICVL